MAVDAEDNDVDEEEKIQKKIKMKKMKEKRKSRIDIENDDGKDEVEGDVKKMNPLGEGYAED